jgi:hypothetical protein
MNKSLTIHGEFPSPSLSLSPEAESKKLALIAAAQEIHIVEDETGDKKALVQVKALAEHRIAFEKNRKEIKDPIVKLGREIDDISRNHLAEILIEEARIKVLRDAHASRLAEIQRQKAAEAEEERRRIEREQYQAEILANEARRKAEAAAALAEIDALRAENEKIKATNDAARKQAEEREREANERQAEINRAAEKAAEAERIEEKKRELELAKLAATAPSKIPDGMREKIDFEITDISIFSNRFPHLVDFVPRRADILKALTKFCSEKPDSLGLPGLKIIKTIVAGRAS